MTLARSMLHPLSPVAAQATSHAVNFLSQLALLHAYGAEVYGELGLGLLVVATLTFLGELGLPTFLLRQAASDTTWPKTWRIAVFHRLLAITLMTVVAFLCWGLWWGFERPGVQLLLTAAPGLLLSACNLAPILYGLNNPRRAALASHVRWTAYGIFTALIAIMTPPDKAAPLLGLAVSAGWIAQHILLRSAPGMPTDLSPNRGRLQSDIRQGAISLTSIGILALLHGRALPFLLAAQAPTLLAPCLLSLQILQGLSSLFGQTDRVLLPTMLKTSDTRQQLAPLRLLIHATGITTSLLILGTVAWSFAYPGSLEKLGGWMILEWSLTQLGFAGYLGVVAQRRERTMLVRHGILLLLLLCLQAFAFAFPPPTELLLAGRALAAAALMGIALAPLTSAPFSSLFRTGALVCLTCLSALWLPVAITLTIAVVGSFWEALNLRRSAQTVGIAG
ncbi:hypothetical protein ACFSM5_17525 [Lacibacterium aquatile]|uniref:O-antigen/teichoic acid export membrane protein n=1 Tax=Lacibacterium aquatile TaxID=1168082 RepID=A0ABW5DUU3_9PROT